MPRDFDLRRMTAHLAIKTTFNIYEAVFTVIKQKLITQN